MSEALLKFLLKRSYLKKILVEEEKKTKMVV